MMRPLTTARVAGSYKREHQGFGGPVTTASSLYDEKDRAGFEGRSSFVAKRCTTMNSLRPLRPSLSKVSDLFGLLFSTSCVSNEESAASSSCAKGLQDGKRRVRCGGEKRPLWPS
eukprot:scaffold2095_cov166-Amphora_coffeaeformis.AAC.6